MHCFKVKELSPKNQITKYNGGGNQYRGKQTLNTQQTDHNENEFVSFEYHYWTGLLLNSITIAQHYYCAALLLLCITIALNSLYHFLLPTFPSYATLHFLCLKTLRMNKYFAFNHMTIGNMWRLV